MSFRFLISALILIGVSACTPSYSPDTYASNAAQQANKVDQGIIVGVRTVGVSAAGTVGTVTGAAAGGIAGAQVGVGPVSAFSALGGSVVGGIAGSAAEHVTGDTTAYEYIVRKQNGDLISVTQRDHAPLALGLKVLVIAGVQARVIPDDTISLPSPPAKVADTARHETPADAKPAGAQPAGPQPTGTIPSGATPPSVIPPSAIPAGIPSTATAPNQPAATPATVTTPAIPVEIKPVGNAPVEAKPTTATDDKPATPVRPPGIPAP